MDHSGRADAAPPAARTRRVLQILDVVVDVPIPERGRFLDGTCGGDEGLRSEIVRLLGGAKEDLPLGLRSLVAGATTGPSAGGDDEADADLPAGHRLDGFTIVRLIGRGGMGTVYEAEQADPSRRVAVKVLRPGIVRGTALRRFRREIAALARLEDPGITRILEAGIDRTEGVTRRWFAMELVDGEPVDRYVASRSFSLREVLGLMVRICRAVAAAHQRGIIHRDLKPANILVTAGGVPRVIDFGVAAALVPEALGTFGLTADGPFLGTLPYTAPEQFGEDPPGPDVRSDVYALGMVLHELLAGRPALEIAGATFAEALRVMREVEPSRLGVLRRDCRGDIEAVVGRAVDKTPARRYATCHGFADDLERILAGVPVTAARPGPWRRIRLFVLRHRIGFAAALVSAAAIAAGTVMGVQGRIASERAGARVATLRGSFEELVRLYRDLGGQVFPAGQRLRLFDSLLAQVRTLERLTPDDVDLALLESDVREQIGDAHLEVGSDLDAAAQAQAGALAIRGRLLDLRPGDRSLRRRLSVSLVKNGDLMKDRGDSVRARDWYAKALKMDLALVAEDAGDVRALDNLSWSFERMGCLAWDRGDHAEAERLWGLRHEAAVDLARRDPDRPEVHYGLFCSFGFQGRAAQRRGDAAGAESASRSMLAAADRMVALRPERIDWINARSHARLNHALHGWLPPSPFSGPWPDADGREAAELGLRADPRSVRWLRALSKWLMMDGVLAARFSDEGSALARAAASFQRAVEMLESAHELAPDLNDLRSGLAENLCYLAETRIRAGDPAAAVPCLRRALAVLDDGHDPIGIRTRIEARLAALHH